MPCMMCVWIKQLGLETNGRIIDTMIVTALLNENRTFEKKKAMTSME